MNDSLIREIADQIIRQAIFENWRTYALLLAFSLVSACASAFLKRYFEKRGETMATSADLHEVLRQLKSTTEVAEQVRSAVSHADWVSREWKSLRRTKLEELVEVAQSLETWLDAQRSAWLFPSDDTRGGPTPMDRVSMLSALYFPELEQMSATFEASGRNAYAWIVNTAARGIQIHDLQARGVYYEQARGEWTPLYNEVRSSTARIREEASRLMREMRDV